MLTRSYPSKIAVGVDADADYLQPNQGASDFVVSVLF